MRAPQRSNAAQLLLLAFLVASGLVLFFSSSAAPPQQQLSLALQPQLLSPEQPSQPQQPQQQQQLSQQPPQQQLLKPQSEPPLALQDAFATLLVVFARTAPDAIGYTGAPPSVPALGCVDPPPFGAQCTALADASLRACLRLPGCSALTCPDPAPYQAPHPRLPRAGAVCQARTVRSALAWRAGEALEAGHGMCAPSGCANFFLARLAPGDVAAPQARALAAALRARGLQRHGTLLAWGGAGEGASSAQQRQLLAAGSLPLLTVLHADASSSGSAPWLLQPSGSSAAAVLREQLGEAGAGQQQLPWASLNASSLAVYLYDDAPV